MVYLYISLTVPDGLPMETTTASHSSLLLTNIRSFPPKSLHRVTPAATTASGFRPQSSTNFQTHTKHFTKNTSKKPNKFLEEDAFPSSLPLHSKNPHVVYHDIQRFAMRGKLKEAIIILDYLDREGIPVNVTTFSSLITACVKFKDLRAAYQVHAYIRVNGLDGNEFLRTKLVRMYTSCGSLDDANKLFDGMPEKNVFTWNALLRGKVISGKRLYSEVLSTFSEMRELGLDLNVYSFSCLIKSLAGASALTQGLKVHGVLVKNGLLSSLMLLTSLIDFYFKCGKVKLARRMFEEIIEKDVVAWGAMIAGFAHNRLQREALAYTKRMVKEGIYPNSVILTTILPVIGDTSMHKLGREVHAYVVKTKSYSRQLFIQSALVDMYCKCGDMGAGRRVCFESKERNAISWTALMSGYVSNGKPEQAMRSVTWMQQEGFKPDVVTVATAVPICAELKALKPGMEIHGYAVKNWFLPNVSIITSLMVMYSKCGKFEYSSNLFNTMERRNVISWTAMIDSCIENGRLYDAVDVFRSMQLSKHRADSVAVSRMLKVCKEIKNLKLSREIHSQILKKCFENIPFVSSELVKVYGVCGAIDKAKLVFDVIPTKGSMTKTAILEAYGYSGIYRDAIDLFHSMIKDDFIPNHYTLDVLLWICKRAEFADEACRIFKMLTGRYKIIASDEHYSTIIKLLNHTGYVAEARRYIKMRSSSSV